ncbi:MAG: alpha/beta hydrolase [Anaerolineae bacterium]|nr:alpha/beta hydrolase [Anaerolineae bacterium]
MDRIKKNRKRLVRGLRIVLAVIAVAVAGFVIWGSTPLSPSSEARAALLSDGSVTVTDDEWLTFAPASVAPTTGLVLYPGGRVDPRAYAQLARALAARGTLVVIVPMPLNLAVLAPGRAAEVIEAYPEVGVWAVGGHSLGGAMAANFARRHASVVDGLVLWAAYPAASDDLSARDDLAVLSVYATLDGLMTDVERIASEERLPSSTCWVEIVGGNHAQFGAYGVQRGDNPATLSASVQQVRIMEATAAFLQTLPAFARGGQVTCPVTGGGQ